MIRSSLPFVAIAVAGSIAYSNSFTVPFVFDDQSSIVQATKVHALDLRPGSLAPALEGFPAGRWLAYLTFAMNHAIGGSDPTGYHVVNLLFHIGAAFAVLLLSREVLARVGGLPEPSQRRAALVAALIFTLHPVQTMAVTYVVQRMTSMGAFFGLGSLLLFVRARTASGAARALGFTAAIGLAYLAFACKENLVVLPLLALALEALLFRGLATRMRRHPVATAGLAAAVFAVGLGAAWWYAGVIGTEAVRYRITVAERLLTQPRVLWHYLSLLALPLPSRLHIDYVWIKSTGLLSPPSTVLALLALMGLVGAAVLLRHRAPLFSFAVAWFLGSLAVEQTILPIDLVFEHRLYVAAIGWFLFAGWGVERALGGRPFVFWLVATPAIALLTAGTFARNTDWNDPVVLYSDPAGFGPGQAGNLLNLARELRARERPAEAKDAIEKALLLEPSNTGAMVTLASLYRDLGRSDDAVVAYRRALARDSSIPQAWFGLSWTLYLMGRTEEAEEAARSGLQAAPSFQALRVALSACRERQGDLDGARRELEQAVLQDPGLWAGWANLAQILMAQGRHVEAVSAAQRYVAGVPDDPMAHVILGRALVAAGRHDAARAAYLRALHLSPGHREATAGLTALGRR